MRPLLLFAVFSLLVVPSPAATDWWNPDWPLRYEIAFDPVPRNEKAQACLVTFRPQMAAGEDPYDVRAVDDAGTTLPLRVLEWTPAGEATFLVGTQPTSTDNDRSVFLYLGNPDAPALYLPFDWREPQLLIGPNLPRRLRRHGAWEWRIDERFAATHVSNAAGKTRLSHAVTGLDQASLLPHTSKIVQAVRLDLAVPPTAIALDFFLDGGVLTAVWTGAPEPPADTVADLRTVRIGPLPRTGEWTFLELAGSDLGLTSPRPLQGVGFSAWGGNAEWGPTALGAVPVVGKVVSREVLSRGETPEIASEDFSREIATAWPTASLAITLQRAPLFARSGASLSLTWNVTPLPAYTGPLLETFLAVELDARAQPEDVNAIPVRFVGGDDWQGTTDIPEAAWRRATRITGGIRAGEAWITSATLRLEPLGPLPGLRANGNLLEAGEETVIFKPTEIIPGARAAPDGPILEFRTDLAAPPGRARPTAADWIAAASEAVRSGKYSAARIVIGTQFDDLGIAPRDVALYLTGLIRLLQSRSGLQVALDLEPLRQAEPTPRNHALLASCLEASAAIRDHDGSLPAQDLPKNR